MAINFPTAPALGTVYPSPAIAGVPQYTWDGQVWLTIDTTDAAYVRRSGDTMTGDLYINKGGPSLVLDRNTTGTDASRIFGRRNNVNRWIMSLGDGVVEDGSNNGSNFTISKHNNDGSPSPIWAMTIERGNGEVRFGGSAIKLDMSGTASTMYFGNKGGVSGFFGDGTNLGMRAWSGGGCYLQGPGGTPTYASFLPTLASISTELLVSGHVKTSGSFESRNGRIQTNTSVSAAVEPCVSAFSNQRGVAVGFWCNTSNQIVLGATDSSGSPLAPWAYAGGATGTSSMGLSGSAAKMHWDNAGVYYFYTAAAWTHLAGADLHMYFANNVNAMRVQSDGNLLMLNAKQPYKPGGGPWLDNSDERIKTVLGNYEHGLAEIVALQPVRYVFKGNDTGAEEQPSSLRSGEAPKEGVKVTQPTSAPYPNSPHYTQATSNSEMIGLIAQAVEGVLPEMVSKHTAMIDGQPVTDLRTLDTGPLVFALINAVKELSARVEALESA